MASANLTSWSLSPRSEARFHYSRQSCTGAWKDSAASPSNPVAIRAIKPGPCTSPQGVSGAGNRPYELDGMTMVDLVAEPTDVDLHQVWVGLKSSVPHMLHDLAARDDIRGAQEKKFEQAEFRWGERDPDAVPLNPAPVRIELEVGAAQQGLALPIAPADQRAHARH
jgi:hypothetical protein